MPDGLVEELKGSVAIRWQEGVALDRIIAEYLDLVGADVLHSEVTEMIDACRAKVVELHGAVEALGGRFDLPEPTEATTANLRARVDWEVLKPAAPASPPLPKWISEKEQAELAEAEARWEAELGSSKD